MASTPQGKDEDERTLLHSACASGSLQLVQWLVERGANQVNAADEEVSCRSLCVVARDCHMMCHRARRANMLGVKLRMWLQ